MKRKAKFPTIKVGREQTSQDRNLIANDEGQKNAHDAKSLKKTTRKKQPSNGNLPFPNLSEDDQQTISINLDGLDLDTLGNNFRSVERKKPQVVQPTTDETIEIDAETATTREDLQRKALESVVTAFDLPTDLVENSRAKLRENIQELSSFLATDVLPVILAVEPSFTTVKRAIPEILDTEMESEDVQMPYERVQSYAQHVANLRTRVKLLEMLNMPEDVRDKLLTHEFRERAAK